MKNHEKYWATAVHEAAHAVAALDQGLSFEFIHIWLDGGWFSKNGRGIVRICEPGHEMDTDDEPAEHQYHMYPDQMLVQSLASYPAEYRAILEMGYRESVALRELRESTGSDRSHAAGYAQYASLTWDAACEVADDIVDDYWPVITDLAAVLVDSGGYLAWSDAMSVIQSVSV